MSIIKFGTSGWRGIISDAFTFGNVELAAHAIAQHLNENPPRDAKRLLIVGHDTRFLSREFARRCAGVIASHGFEVLLTDRDAPTPVISHSIRVHRAAGGINITASHNPFEWNGLKFNEANGAPSSPETAKAIETKAEVLGSRFPVLSSIRKVAAGRGPGAASLRSRIKEFDPRPKYFAQLRKLINFAALAKRPNAAVVDLMFGTGRGYLDELLANRGGWTVDALHGEVDPLFGDGHPEPIREHLGELLARLKKSRAALGLGLDPDADRFAIVDRDGTFINANQILALALHHLAGNRKWTGAVVRTVATSHLVDAVAAEFGVKVRETPVGFKYIGAVMETEPVIVGGEESGGLSVKGHVPEKDGILACLLMAELVAYEGKALGKILKEIQTKAGGIISDRINLQVTSERKEKLLQRFASGLKRFAGRKVTDTVTTDGHKFLLGDGCWVMFRASGTEPVFRCYLEARTRDQMAGFRRAAWELVK
ncbi:MAG TPA: phosphoglucomutase/phosphomannomutase family protein [Verrucomicrobiae bacterium]|nr:phosphoglucomutase/phosphomannomutase family protein [Verrucomicrobiae bacterium]